MHARQSREQKGTHFTNTAKTNVTIDLNGKTTSCDGMQPARLKRTTSHLVPHLGGVAASIGATHWHVRVPMLCNCGAEMSLNQYVNPTSL